MVEMALNGLSERGIADLDSERRAAMVSNLLVVLCSRERYATGDQHRHALSVRAAMNALALWIPGTLLVLIGALLLVLGRLEFSVALAVIGCGIALETVGTLLWIRQRKPPAG